MVLSFFFFYNSSDNVCKTQSVLKTSYTCIMSACSMTLPLCWKEGLCFVRVARPSGHNALLNIRWPSLRGIVVLLDTHNSIPTMLLFLGTKRGETQSPNTHTPLPCCPFTVGNRFNMLPNNNTHFLLGPCLPSCNMRINSLLKHNIACTYRL